MRLHRFYIPEKIGAHTEITLHSAELVNQVRRVFRLKKDDHLVIFDGSGSDYVCTIDNFEGSPTIDSNITSPKKSGHHNIHLNVTSSSKSRFTPHCTIYLCAAVVKKDTFEWIVEKATELGVTDIVPLGVERSEKKSLNQNRLNKIAVEASEQSGRGDVPMIHDIMGLEEAIQKMKSGGIEMLAFHTEGETMLKSIRADKMKSCGVFIGPEGGWSEKEIDLFHREDIPVVTLGPQVLRAETAVIAALSQVVFS